MNYLSEPDLICGIPIGNDIRSYSHVQRKGPLKTVISLSGKRETSKKGVSRETDP